MKNRPNFIHSFGLILPAIFPDTVISSCACIVLLSEASSSSHVLFLIARQRDKFASERSKIRRLTSQKPKFCQICIIRGTLVHFNLSHMDFLEHRAATTTCTDPIPCTTNSASPNEYKYPEIWMKNRPNRIHSFPGSRPAIFLAEYYFLLCLYSIAL